MRLGLLLLLVILGGMAWIRLAPSDPARWNADPPASAGLALLPGAEGVIRVPFGARARLEAPGDAPDDALARLDAIALATPRTRRLAGSPEAGRITWITRSLVFGFPDYTTATATPSASGAGIDLYARERFGRYDFGVNAARLRDWTSQFTP